MEKKKKYSFGNTFFQELIVYFDKLIQLVYSLFLAYHFSLNLPLSSYFKKMKY
jgi:hypothetical protein